jgi:hypothetical protein
MKNNHKCTEKNEYCSRKQKKKAVKRKKSLAHAVVISVFSRAVSETILRKGQEDLEATEGKK